MQEFILLVRNTGDGKAHMDHATHTRFLKACETYIGSLVANKNLISAQPMAREGRKITGNTGAFAENPYSGGPEQLVGYYLIRAQNMDEAMAIAKRNPEFEYVTGASVEVRPLKMVEQSTEYLYPAQS